MTKGQIINRLAHNVKIKKAAYNIGGSYSEDLYQHLFLTLCELPAKKIQDAHKKKYIEFLCIKIMQNSFHSYSSPFAVQFRQFGFDESIKQDIEDIDIMEELIENEKLLKPIETYLNQPINQENFYRITLVTMWANGESYRKIAAKTRIPMRSIAAAIQQAIKEIKECY